MSDLALNLRIRVNADGSVQTVNQTSQSINNLASTTTAASQRISAGMSSSATASQIASRVMQTSTGSISAGMSSAASSTQISAATIANSLRTASSAGRASMQSMTESMVTNLSAINATLTAMDARLAASGAGMSSMAMRAGSTTGALMLMRGGAALVVYEFARMAKDMVDTVEQVQNIETRLRSLTTSARDYAETESYLSTVAAVHHKNNLDLQGSFAQLLTIEQTGIITRNQTKQILEGMSNAQSRTGATADALKNSMTGMTQALSMGTLAWEEIKQVTEPLPGLMMKIAEAAGFTGKTAIGDFKALVSSGQYTSQMFGEILPVALSKYDGAAAQSGANLTAQYADIKNAWTELAKVLESPISDTLTPILTSARNSLSTITDAIKYLKSLNAVGDQGMRAPGYVRPEKSETFSGLLSQPFTTAAKVTQLADAQKDAILVGQDYLRYLSNVEETDKKIAEAKKQAAAETKRQAEEAAREAENFVKKSDEIIVALLNEAEIRKVATKDQARETELRRVESAVVESQRDYVKGLINAKYDEIEATKLRDAAGNAGKAAMDAEIDRYNKLTLSAHDYFVEKLKAQGVAPDKIPAISALHDKSDGIEKSIAAAKTYSDELKNITRSTQDLAVTGTEAFDIFNKGFGSLGSVFDSVTKSIDKASAAIEDNASKAADAAKNGNYDTKQKAELAKAYVAEDKKLQAEKTIAELRGGRQLAEATSKMFGEKTAAAQGFHNLALVLGAAEMAMEAKKIVVYVAGIIPKVAAGAATMFAQSGWGGFAGVAAMAAVMAGLGYAAFSGGGSSAPPVISSDTGTVLGDSTAKSESIDKTYELLKSIHAEEYVELRGINKGISDLRNGITDTVTRLFQAGGIKDFATLAPATNSLTGNGTMGSPIHQAVVSFLFGGQKTQTVIQQGIATQMTAIADIMAGADLIARQFAVIETKTKGGLFTKTKTSYSTQFAELDADTQKAMTTIFKSVGETMLGLADSLGEGLSDRVKNYIIPALTIDLKGLSGEDATKKLSGVISTALDTMAGVVFGDILGQYQQLGEGMLETAIRIVSEVAVVKDALSKSGLSLASNALYIADTIAKAAGSLEEFQKQFGTYFDKFYTDAEKQADLQNRLLTVLDGSLATSRDGYRQQIEALDLTNEKDLERYSLLIKMAGAADQYYSALEAAAEATDALLKTLSDDVTTARNNLAEAYKNESAALTATIDKFDAFAKSLKNFRAGLLVGDLSTGTPEDKYLAAKYQFNSTLNKVKAGAGSTDASKAAYELALSDIQNKATAFLSSSREFNASGEDYKTDFNSVLSAINKGIIGADAAKTDAQNQLTVLNKSVEGLITINKSVLSVKDAITALGKSVGYEQATKDLIAATTLKDSTALTAAASKKALDAGIARAGADERAASEAGAKAAALKSFAPAPTTYISGQTNNPIWEKVLGEFNARHSANYGKPMDRPWNAGDEGAAMAYQALVGQYNALSVSAYQVANATAIALSGAATASAALIPALQATWTADKTAADNALAAYSTATALANAAKPVAETVNPVANATKPKVMGTYRTGLSRVPFDGFIAELHKDERVLTAEESANYNHAQQRVEIAIARPAWLDNLTIKPGAAAPQNDARMIDALQKTIDELKEQNKHLRASVNVLQAGFTKLIQQNAEQAEHLEDIGTFTKRALS